MKEPSDSVKEYLKELIFYDYNMGNSLYAVKKNQANYLHDEELRRQLDRLHYSLRKWAEGEL